MMKFKKVMSLILSVLIMVGVFSAATPVIAAEVTEATTEEKTETTEKVEQSEFEAAEFEESEPIVIGEDKSRRDESTKHFILSNGTRKAVRYSHPIHYEKNGEWVDIDNSLVYDEESDSYKNKDNSFKVGFGKSLNSEKLLSIENEGYTLEWKYKGSLLRRSIVNAQISEIKEKDLRESEKAVENSKSEIKYKGFEDNCDLEYVVTGNGVKENIILENKSCKNKFVFEVTADGLELVKNEDGSLSALEKETKEEIFYIPAPFMFDAAKEYSYDVEYSIQEIKGKYLITVTASEEWLKAEGRAYPVTVDPVIQTKRTKSAISTTFVASGKPSTNFNDMQDVYIGIESTNYEICRALVKFDLPELNSGDMVIGAYLGLCLHSASFYTSAMPDKQIDAHLVTGSWSDSAVTWNTRPAFDSTVYDYNFIKRSDASGGVDLKPFDVTKAVKEWYEGESNNGLMIKAHVEEGSDSEVAARGIFWSDKYNGVEERYPYIEITYRNNKGLENMWSYTSLGVEEAGAANINDYSGNMVYAAPIHSTESSVLPINLIGYFNGYAAGNAVAVKSPAGTNLVRTTIGQGWRLNVQQTLLPSSQYGLTGDDAENYPYVYTDGDGTEHYIQKITEDGETVYKDESGLDLTLTIGEEYNGTAYAYTLKGKDGTSRMTFNVNGNLTNIFNGYGKSMHITYKPATTNLPEKSRILSVTDGSGHKLTFTYNTNSVGVENSYVSKITDSAGREVSFTYTKSTVDESIYNLTKISYPDGTHNNYDYTGYKFKSAENHYGNLINFSYTSASTGSRVKAAREYSKNGDQGQLITFDRTKYNTTVIRSAGMDGYHYNDDSAKGDDDVITTLQFDNAGRTVSQQVKFGNGSAVGSGSYSYTSPTDDTSTSPAKNKVASTGSLGKNVVNLLNGGNCESLSSWNQNASESATTDNAVSNAEKYIGSGSIKLKTTALSAAGVNYMAQSVSGASANSSYTLSAYVKTIGVTEKFSGESNGAYIQLRAFNSSNEEITTVISETIVRETDTAINNGWKRLTVTLPKTTGISSIKAYICFRNMTGKAYFDCIQLETGAVANDYNMLENSSFEKSSSGMPQKWTAENISYSVSDGTVTEGITDSTDANGSYSVKVTGDAAVEKKLHQTVNVESNKNDTYILSGWGGGKPVNSTYHTKQTEGQATTSEEDDEYENTALFEICPKVIYNKKNADKEVVDTVFEYKPAAKFNTTITGWQFASSAFSLKKEKTESGFTYDPIKITVIIRYYNQANAVYFDHIMLTKEPSPTYTYDKEGNLVALNANPEQKVDADYDDKGNLTSFTDTVGNETKIEYNQNNLPTITESAKGVFSATSYNSNGLADISHTRNKKSTENTNNLMIIKTNQSYYTDDESTAIDESMFQKSVYDEHGVAAATYTYDYATGNIETVTDANGAVTTNTYGDDNDKDTIEKKTHLKKVTFEGSTVSYTYSGNRLTKILFGTGSTEEEYSFAFDKWGNVSSTKVGGVTLSSNTYLPRNGALSLTSYGNGDKIEYEYNNLGLKTSVVRTNVLPNSSTETDSFYWSYSADGTPKAHKDSENNRRYVYDYDSLGRLVSQEITNSARTKYIGFLEQSFDLRGNVNKLTYEFGGRSFSQIYSRSKSTLNTENSESYAKDNLPTVYKIASDKYVLYDYDSLNRLNQKTYHLSGSKSLYYNYKFKLSERNDSGNLYRTSQVATEYIVDDVYGYAYDSAGNIIRITKAERNEAGKATAEVKADSTEAYRSYEYDKKSQLTRENNKTSGKSSVFVYDSLGNIGSKTTYAYSTAETLSSPVSQIDHVYGTDSDAGWNKLLTSVAHYEWVNGVKTLKKTEIIDYDSIGNPVKYRDDDLTWNGRQLSIYEKSQSGSVTESGVTVDATQTTELSYSYDANGLRAGKSKQVTVVYYSDILGREITLTTDTPTSYQYAGDKLVYQVTTDADGEVGKELYFFYDSNDNLAYIKFYDGGSAVGNYFVTTNLQGDVLGLYNSSGTLVASYEYDAWGNCEIVSDTSGVDIASINPIRYRGYYYDSDTGLYYLQSRYYDPEIGRFINADGFLTTDVLDPIAYNMFAYCGNNPVMYSDPSGTTLFDIFKDILELTMDVLVEYNLAKSTKNAAQAHTIIDSNDDVNASDLVGVLSILLDNTTEAYESSQNNNIGVDKIIWDMSIEIAYDSLSFYAGVKIGASIGSIIGTTLGTAFAPGLGTVAGKVIGVIAGAMAGYGVTKVVDACLSRSKEFIKGRYP